MRQRALALVQRMSIGSKFIWAAVVLLLALFCSGVYVCSRSFAMSYADHLATAKGDFAASLENIMKFEKRMVHLASQLQANKQITTLLPRLRQFSAGEYLQARQELQPIMYTMLDGSGDYFCRLYVDSSLDLLDNTSRILTLDLIRDTPWAKQALSGWGNWRFYPADALAADAPALIVPMRNPDNYGDLTGILRVDLTMASIIARLQPPRSQTYVSYLLQTANGDTVAASDASMGSFTFNAPKSTLEGFSSFGLNTVQQGKDTVFYQSLPYSGWRLVTLVHYDKLYSTIFPQLLALAVFGCLLALLGLLCAAPILMRTTSRITRFSAYVQRYSSDSLRSLPPSFPPQGSDEIGCLIQAHNVLLGRISHLITQQEQREQELRRLELSVLQAQIKPHFLYNTLEAVIWMAKMHQPDKVETTVRSLTQFYRLCLSHGQDVLPLSQELEIVCNYFAIQCMRYDRKFHLSIQVPPQMLHIVLPKITLQPLVENALVHGILESDNKDGEIIILGRLDKGYPELCIMDSGAHLTQAVWELALHSAHPEEATSPADGYGLKNVERRLCLHLHRESVLYLDKSDPNHTCIVLPLQ